MLKIKVMIVDNIDSIGYVLAPVEKRNYWVCEFSELSENNGCARKMINAISIKKSEELSS